LGWNINRRRKYFAPCRAYSAFFCADHSYFPRFEVRERNTLSRQLTALGDAVIQAHNARLHFDSLINTAHFSKSKK
jgi:hypothetical protein